MKIKFYLTTVTSTQVKLSQRMSLYNLAYAYKDLTVENSKTVYKDFCKGQLIHIKIWSTMSRATMDGSTMVYDHV